MFSFLTFNIGNIFIDNTPRINIARRFLPDEHRPFKKKLKPKKEKYIERYKELLDKAQSTNEVLPTHWAYVTDAGIIEYEKSTRGMPEYDYGKENGIQQLDSLSSKIAKVIKNDMAQSSNVAFMVYGFGNSIREQYVIDEICKSIVTKKCSAVKVIFIDVSYYYCSQFYWAGILDHSKQKYHALVNILDFIHDEDQIKKLRGDLKKSTVIHLFMGNIAGNYEEKKLRSICQAYTWAGDYLLMEYGEYNFQNMQPDNYQHAFATEALREIYQKEGISDIKTEDIINQERRHIKIKFSLNGSTAKQINSFLRRNFIPTEFSEEKFETIQTIKGLECGKTPCGKGNRKITLFSRRP